MEQYIEIVLLSLLIALMYKTPIIITNFVETNKMLSRIVFVILIVLLQKYFGLNSGILAVGIFFAITYNKKILEGLDIPIEADESFEAMDNIGVADLDPKDSDKQAQYTSGTISKRNMVDLDRKFKKEAEKKKNSSVFAMPKNMEMKPKSLNYKE